MLIRLSGFQRVKALENDVGYILGIVPLRLHSQAAVIQSLYHHAQFKICQVQTVYISSFLHGFIPSFHIYCTIKNQEKQLYESVSGNCLSPELQWYFLMLMEVFFSVTIIR